MQNVSFHYPPSKAFPDPIMIYDNLDVGFDLDRYGPHTGSPAVAKATGLAVTDTTLSLSAA